MCFTLIIEVDGKIHETQKDYDEGRTAELNRWGLRVIRFTNEEVVNEIEKVVEEIKAQINLLSTKNEQKQSPL